MLSLCDGANSAEEVAERVQRACDLATTRPAVVTEILTLFLREGLIARRRPSPADGHLQIAARGMTGYSQ